MSLYTCHWSPDRKCYVLYRLFTGWSSCSKHCFHFILCTGLMVVALGFILVHWQVCEKLDFKFNVLKWQGMFNHAHSFTTDQITNVKIRDSVWQWRGPVTSVLCCGVRVHLYAHRNPHPWWGYILYTLCQLLNRHGSFSVWLSNHLNWG